MAFDELLLFEPQCCDAVEYLQLGLLCAEGQCQDALRPLGTALWFSLPYRLGLAPEWLVALHLLLLLLSALLGARAMLLLSTAPRSPRTGLAIGALSLLAHAAWFWPLWRVSLSDLPASVLALCGCWLLLLAARHRHATALALAGAFALGTACLVRTFFLYPLYGALLAWLLAALASRQWRGLWAAVLLALLPPLLQYGATWRQTGEWSYLHPRWSENWSYRHLQDPATGYDTVSVTPYRWYTAPCAPRDWLASLKERDMRGAACLALGRLQFYLGSYSARTFHFGEHDDLLVPPGRDGFGQAIGGWQSTGLVSTTQPDPSHVGQLMTSLAWLCPSETSDQPLCRASVASSGNLLFAAQPAGYLQQAVRLSASQPHTFSALTWSPAPVRLRASLLDARYAVLAEAEWPVGPTPALHSLAATPLRDGLHRVRLTVTGADSAAPLALWGLKLEQGNSPVWQEGVANLPPDAIRWWSPWLLAANSVVVLAALACVWQRRRQWLPPQWAAFAFVALSAGLSVVIVPEQRFFVVPLVACWLLAGSRALISSPDRNGSKPA